jgi:hypothetical protein
MPAVVAATRKRQERREVGFAEDALGAVIRTTKDTKDSKDTKTTILEEREAYGLVSS